ncbi:MAG: cell division protein ZapE [Gemmatimonadetes bacterium]|nr:cell division protein ZapE [Gemmatimonadota bacterium]
MLSLDALLASLTARPNPDALIASFVPPVRFAGKRFRKYQPDPRFPSQSAALEHLRKLAADLIRRSRRRLLRQLQAAMGQGRRGGGTYLDGGFGVGKTHLLASLWNVAPGPKAYLSFDELVYTLGLLGVAGTRSAFRQMRLVAVDEWELDDPGNLKLALAFLRGALEDGTWVVATSNTVPDELGRGRFSQKDFAAEIEELASSFEVIRIEGEDFRHRHFQADPGREYFMDPDALVESARTVGEGVLLVSFRELLLALGTIHPIRYADLADAIRSLHLQGMSPLTSLPEALRWVHWIDKLYDGGVRFVASSESPLGELIPAEFLAGAYGKKFGRCLSRMEEMLGEGAMAPSPTG